MPTSRGCPVHSFCPRAARGIVAQPVLLKHWTCRAVDSSRGALRRGGGGSSHHRFCSFCAAGSSSPASSAFWGSYRSTRVPVGLGSFLVVARCMCTEGAIDSCLVCLCIAEWPPCAYQAQWRVQCPVARSHHGKNMASLETAPPRTVTAPELDSQPGGHPPSVPTLNHTA